MEGSPKIATQRKRRGVAADQGSRDVTDEGFSKSLNTDATDEEQSSDDEAPEEVSAAAATALAGLRRKAEHQARQAAAVPKRKRARTSLSKGAGSGKNVSLEDGGSGDDEGGSGDDGLELPSDLLLRVKSGGLQRMEADVLEAREADERAGEGAEGGRRPARVKAGDFPRSDNFRLVVLDEDDGGVDDNAGSKAHAAESAKKFLRDRMGSRKRVSHSLFKARKRLGPSPDF